MSSLTGLVRMSTETFAQFQCFFACFKLRCFPSVAVSFVGVAVQFLVLSSSVYVFKQAIA